MSYIRAQKVPLEVGRDGVTYAPLPGGDVKADVDMNLDDEILSFVVALIARVEALGEGEALVVWKEIF